MIRPVHRRWPAKIKLVLAGPVLAGLALAASTPLLADRRIEQVVYSADAVVAVRAQSRVQTMIEFAPDEHIENIALGDSAAWQVTPNKRANLLFIKPLSTRTRTNMTVVTDQRRYLFDLVTAPASARPVYVLRFAYPEQLVLPLANALAPGAGALPPATAPLPGGAAPAAPTTLTALPAPPPNSSARNTGWRITGERSLQPSEVYDDGQATYLVWPEANDLPAILAPAADGGEGPVNFTIRAGTIVIDGVAPRYLLRLGKASVLLTRTTPPAGSPETRP